VYIGPIAPQFFLPHLHLQENEESQSEDEHESQNPFEDIPFSAAITPSTSTLNSNSSSLLHHHSSLSSHTRSSEILPNNTQERINQGISTAVETATSPLTRTDSNRVTLTRQLPPPHITQPEISNRLIRRLDESDSDDDSVPSIRTALRRTIAPPVEENHLSSLSAFIHPDGNSTL
jgi:hypothetical protein